MSIEELIWKVDCLSQQSKFEVALFINVHKGTTFTVMLDDWSCELKNTYEASKLLDKIEAIVEYEWI